MFYKMRKKAQIATTLTWIPAMVVIFFIMFLFVAATGVLTGGKFLSGDKNSLSLENEKLDFFVQNLVVETLNAPVEKESVNDLILKWWLSKDDELKEQIENAVKESLEGESFGYVFRINYDLEKEYGDYIDVRNREIVFPEEIYEMNLFLNGEKINVEMYVEK